MREVNFKRSQLVPEIDAYVLGRKKSFRVRFIFDTGSGITQLDIATVEDLGYSARDAEELLQVHGAAGEPVQGYIVKLKEVNVFGVPFSDARVLCYDFENFAEVDGLLGFDLIKQLHLEMDGPRGVLRIF